MISASLTFGMSLVETLLCSRYTAASSELGARVLYCLLLIPYLLSEWIWVVPVVGAVHY